MKWSKRRPWSAEKLMTLGGVSGLLLLLGLIILQRGPAEASVNMAEHSLSPRIDASRTLPMSSARPRVPLSLPAVKAPTEAPAEVLVLDLLFPVPQVSPHDVADSFNDARGARVHHAVDILAPRHADVVAVADGTIARMMVSDAGGITLYQWSADRQFIFYYAHLQGYALGLAEGQPLKRGQTLGYVGTTGNAPPNTPHLHFSISRMDNKDRWWGGRAINPYLVWRKSE